MKIIFFKSNNNGAVDINSKRFQGNSKKVLTKTRKHVRIVFALRNERKNSVDRY